MTQEEFQKEIRLGIPDSLPEAMPYDKEINHAPKRKDILTPEEKRLALRNALRYFPKHLHEQLAPEFMEELHEYGRIYMYRYRPRYEMHARPINEYPHKSEQAAAIMLMIQNNLDPAVAQHPHELIVYGGNGAIFLSSYMRSWLLSLSTSLIAMAVSICIVIVQAMICMLDLSTNILIARSRLQP